MSYIYLGQLVKTSLHKNALVYMIKRIDTEQEQVYIVPLDSSFCGQWYSSNALYNA